VSTRHGSSALPLCASALSHWPCTPPDALYRHNSPLLLLQACRSFQGSLLRVLTPAVQAQTPPQAAKSLWWQSNPRPQTLTLLLQQMPASPAHPCRSAGTLHMSNALVRRGQDAMHSTMMAAAGTSRQPLHLGHPEVVGAPSHLAAAQHHCHLLLLLHPVPALV
jgi:hypothetical protein